MKTVEQQTADARAQLYRLAWLWLMTLGNYLSLWASSRMPRPDHESDESLN